MIAQIIEIVEIAKSISIEEIKNLAQQLKDEKDDFDFKKKISEAVKSAFSEAFESEHLPYNITYQGIYSQDVVITNLENQKSFFIEIKSLSKTNRDKSLRLAVSQARKAVEQASEGNYIVSALIRPTNWELTTVDFIKSNLNSQFNIGSLLTSVVEKDKTFEQLFNTSGDIDLFFEDKRRKVIIAEKIWMQNGKSFKDLIDVIKQYLG